MPSGRGPDIDNPSNLNINDVLGDYSLTLIDSLDTLAIMGNVTEFKKAVKLVVDNVSFDKPYTVQVRKHFPELQTKLCRFKSEYLENKWPIVYSFFNRSLKPIFVY